jgi:hypothetical protein
MTEPLATAEPAALGWPDDLRERAERKEAFGY